MRKWTILISSLAALAGGCVHPSAPLSVKDPDPSIKIPAIKLAVAKDNRSVIPQLVHDLESDDPAVRFYSIQGLRRFTGDDFGYRFYEDRLSRAPAIERWRQWLGRQPAMEHKS